MDIEQNRDQHSKALYDAVDHTECGAALYRLYSKDGFYSAEILVQEDGRICEAKRYQVNDDLHAYPDALAGDHRHSFSPADLEARVGTLTAVLEATAPRQRTMLSWNQPARNVSRTERSRSREISRERTR